MNVNHFYSLRIPIPREDLARLQEMKYLPEDTNEATLILTNSTATMDYWFWGKKADGKRHTRRTAGTQVFPERGMQGQARLSEILGPTANVYVLYGAQQLWPR